MIFSSPRTVLFYALVALTISLALILPSPVLATDETLPPTEIPAQSAEPSTDVLDQDLTGTVELLNDSGSILTNETGEVVPLVSQEAVDLLSDPDPYIIRGGVTYPFTAGDCDPIVAGLQPCAYPVQAAINFAIAGETINIDPGTYTEQLIINKNITLQGTAPGVVIQSPDSLADCFTTSAANRAIVCVTATDNVSLLNLTVDGAGLGNSNVRFEGIGFFNAGGMIDGSSVINIQNTPLSGVQHGVGIYAYNLDGTPRTLTVTDNLIDDFQKTGIVLNGSNLTVYVDGNTITGAGPTAVTAQNGIQVGYGATGTISNNTVSDIDYTPATWTASGILLYAPGDGVIVSGNTVTDVQTGIYATQADGAVISNNTIDGSSWAIGADTSSDITISNNIVTGSDGDGIDLYEITGADVTGNTVDGSFYDGIWLGGDSSSLTLTNNIITNNGSGVPDLATGGIHVTGNVDAQSLTITNNTFIGNRNGVSNSLIESLVDARGNYWGCVNGPDDPACDQVYQMVLYDPFQDNDPNITMAPPANMPVTMATPYRFVPVTGGQLFDIPCDAPVSLANINGIYQVSFKNLCGYKATIDEVLQESMPEVLPSGESYIAGLSINLFKDRNLVQVVPVGASIVVTSKLDTSRANTTFGMLYWDDKANNNLGAWFTLPSKQEDISRPIELYPDTEDPRLVILGTWVHPNSDYMEVEVNFPGTFILITP